MQEGWANGPCLYHTQASTPSSKQAFASRARANANPHVWGRGAHKCLGCELRRGSWCRSCQGTWNHEGLPAAHRGSPAGQWGSATLPATLLSHLVRKTGCRLRASMSSHASKITHQRKDVQDEGAMETSPQPQYPTSRPRAGTRQATLSTLSILLQALQADGVNRGTSRVSLTRAGAGPGARAPVSLATIS